MSKQPQRIELCSVNRRESKKRLHKVYVQLQQWTPPERLQRSRKDEGHGHLCSRVDQTAGA